MQTWQQWLAACVARSDMVVNTVDLSDVSGWEAISVQRAGIIEKIMNTSGGFFEIVGLMIFGAGREVNGRGQPGIHETTDRGDVFDCPRSGFLCHIFSQDSRGNTNGILVQANTEPMAATPGHVTLAPAIQASFSNLQLCNTPFAELLVGRVDLGNVMKDPGRTDGVNNVSVLTLSFEERRDLELPLNYRWFTVFELDEARSNSITSLVSAPFNGHFWTAFGSASMVIEGLVLRH